MESIGCKEQAISLIEIKQKISVDECLEQLIRTRRSEYLVDQRSSELRNPEGVVGIHRIFFLEVAVPIGTTVIPMGQSSSTIS